MKRTWPKLSKPIRITGCLLILSPFVFIIGSQFFSSVEMSVSVSCMSNQKTMALALLMYAQDYDDHLPPATRWLDAAMPYAHDGYRCPKVNQKDPDHYGYAFNSLLTVQSVSKIKTPETTPLMFDSDCLGRNANAPGLIGLANPPRHYDSKSDGPCDFVAYADGHVHFVKIPSPAP